MLEREIEAVAQSSDHNHEQSVVYEYYYGGGRRLYPKILPDFAGIDDFETDEGFCVEGFGNTACPVHTSAAAIIRHHSHPCFIFFSFFLTVIYLCM